MKINSRDILKTFPAILQKRCQEYFRVIELRKTGLGARKIHQVTSINEGIIKHWIHENVKPMPIKTLEKLKQANLIPLDLYLHNKRNLVLVRCIGFVFGDGHIRKTLTTTRFTGQFEDLIQLKNDLEKIGLAVSNPRENIKNSWNGKSWGNMCL
jgi:hypothetical protein